MSAIGKYWEEKILQLIEHHKTAKLEVSELLKELNSVDDSKMSLEEKEALKCAKIRASEESDYRGIFIDQLENLL